DSDVFILAPGQTPAYRVTRPLTYGGEESRFIGNNTYVAGTHAAFVTRDVEDPAATQIYIYDGLRSGLYLLGPGPAWDQATAKRAQISWPAGSNRFLISDPINQLVDITAGTLTPGTVRDLLAVRTPAGLVSPNGRYSVALDEPILGPRPKVDCAGQPYRL